MGCSKIIVLLTPIWEDEHISKVSVNITADVQGRKGVTLFSFNHRVTNKSFAKIDGEVATYDDTGNLAYLVDQEEAMHIEMSNYIIQRDSQGAVNLKYTVCLEPVGDNPGFDLGYELSGMTGSGMTFLPRFTGDDQCSISVDWNLSKLPEGFRGVWSYGEGKTTATGKPSLLLETFYCAGQLKSVERGNFGIHWLQKPGFDITEIAEWTQHVFGRLSAFFGDDGEPYRIFARKGPCDKLGGTALRRSYQFIYSDEHMPTADNVKFLFAHEMVHNWVKMNDEPFGTCTWYVEGMAEFYAASLLWQYGMISRDELLGELNRRAKVYYENPHIHIKNEEAGKLLFADRDSTRIPYTRGFFYLAQTDAKIRKATEGKKSLDDVMLALLGMHKAGKLPDNQDWLNQLAQILGDDSAAEFESMQSGKVMEPSVDCFGDGIQITKTTGIVRGTDKTCDLWQFK